MIQFQDLLTREHIFFLKAASKEEALDTLVDNLGSLKIIPDTASFKKTLHKREGLMTTAIGLSTALPHAKQPELERFFIAIGIAQNGIEWGADDGLSVKYIFLIGGPDNKPVEYLALLSSITKTLRLDEVRKKLSKAQTADDVIKALNQKASS